MNQDVEITGISITQSKEAVRFLYALQEEGKDAIEMKSGDCINIPINVKHWHGAAPESWFSHLAIEVPGVEGTNEWLEPVNDDVYGKLK